MARNGPRLTATCRGCRHYRQERFSVQGDSGYDGYCMAADDRHIGTYSNSALTPDWCPMLTPIQKESLFGSVLEAQVKLLIDMHGGVRSAARETGLDPGYLSRLARGEKDQPSGDVLERLGLQRHVYYTRIDGRLIPECPHCLAATKAACTCC